METPNENKQTDLPDNILVINNPLNNEEKGDLLPDEPFQASYEVSGQEHKVVIQWIGESKAVAPGYYVFEGEQYTRENKQVDITPEEMLELSEDELRNLFPDKEELYPANATRVIDFTDGTGWSERNVGKTVHSEAISKVIEKAFS